MKTFKQLLKEQSKYVTQDDLHHKLLNHYTGFNIDEKRSIKQYTESSEDINHYHWHKHKNKDNKPPEDVEINSKNLDSALSKHKTPEDMTVYSGTRHDPRDLTNDKGIVHHPAYLSTSLAEKRAQIFARKNENNDDFPNFHHHVLKIHVPKGSPGAYVDQHSTNKGEKEFILPRGTNLKHIKTETGPEEKPPGGARPWKFRDEDTTRRIHTHHMEVI